eukprot:s3466_g3.t1
MLAALRALLQVAPLLADVCNWPVPLPSGYLLTGCDTTAPAEVSGCSVSCGECLEPTSPASLWISLTTVGCWRLMKSATPCNGIIVDFVERAQDNLVQWQVLMR